MGHAAFSQSVTRMEVCLQTEPRVLGTRAPTWCSLPILSPTLSITSLLLLAPQPRQPAPQSGTALCFSIQKLTPSAITKLQRPGLSYSLSDFTHHCDKNCRRREGRQRGREEMQEGEKEGREERSEVRRKKE